MSRRLHHARVEFADAAAFVSVHHRHHTPPVGHVFSLGAYEVDRLCGVAIVGRPVARGRDDGLTLEVTRLCTDGTKDACSFLYGCAARATHALGFERLGTYTLGSEGGASLRAAGWRLVSQVKGRSWDTAIPPPHRQAPDNRQAPVGSRMTAPESIDAPAPDDAGGGGEVLREAFETWVHTSYWPKRDMLGRYEGGGYLNPFLAIAWEAWQAALASRPPILGAAGIAGEFLELGQRMQDRADYALNELGDEGIQQVIATEADQHALRCYQRGYQTGQREAGRDVLFVSKRAAARQAPAPIHPPVAAGTAGELREALEDVLNASGARGQYHALKYGDAVERAEAALAATRGAEGQEEKS